MRIARVSFCTRRLCALLVFLAAGGCAREHAHLVDPASRPMLYHRGNTHGGDRFDASLPSMPWAERASTEDWRADPRPETGLTLEDILSTDSSLLPAPSTENLPVPPRTDAELPPKPVPNLPSLRTMDASTIPDGEACLTQLMGLGVSFRMGPEKKGMKTSVLVDGPIGGVTYRGYQNGPLLCDCRLAVALSWVGADFLALGISEVVYSGAYSYRMSKVGRMSLHAWGLAIDIHEVVASGKRLSLLQDYERGLTQPCSSGRTLNQLGCRLRARGMWREFLTPDTNGDHHDHFHISIKPHGEDPVVRRPQPYEPPVEVPANAKRGKNRVATSGQGSAAVSNSGTTAARGQTGAEGANPKKPTQPARPTPPEPPSAKPAEPAKKTEKPADKPAEKPTQPARPTPPESPSAKPAEPAKKTEKPADKPAEKPAEKPSQPARPTPAQPPSAKPAEPAKKTEKPAEKPAAKPAAP